MDKLWERYREWLKAHAPSLADEVNGPASSYALEETEAELGLKFPDLLRQYFLACDGGKVANGLLGNWDLYSLEDLLEEALTMEERAEEGDFGSNRRPEGGKVKALWWNPAWIPIAGSGNGHYICVDTDPAEEGNTGQVILYFYDSGERPCIAGNVEEWFSSAVEKLERGEVKVSYDEVLDTWVFDQPGLLNTKEI